jgi:hypothetical protein
MFKRIRIPSQWANGSGMADFKLGVGPCGKTAIRLEGHLNGFCYTVKQTCDDGETKYFHYPLSTVTGRIEETCC